MSSILIINTNITKTINIMFYLTPSKNTCFDLEQVLCFYYSIDNETNQINKKELIVQFKNGTGLIIKELEGQKGKVEQIFLELCKYLRVVL